MAERGGKPPPIEIESERNVATDPFRGLGS